MNTQADQQRINLKRQRVKAALINLFIGDSLSMPVHWFYNPGDIIRQFGKRGITTLNDAPESHPSSIMSLHSTRLGGRSRMQGKKSQEIIGEVILKGKRHLWGRANGHYHHGMKSGENTLNAWCAWLLIDHLLENETYQSADWINAYIDFMTADPPPHPDTYAESYHRAFFANWITGKAPLQCGAVTHDTPSMGALVTVAPLALSLLGSGEPVQDVCAVCREHVHITHPDSSLLQVVDAYVKLMNYLLERDENDRSEDPFISAAAVINGTRLDQLLQGNRGDTHVVGKTYSLACYITDSWPSVCYLAARYQADDSVALLTNTNLGGENAHRGSVLGSLAGLSCAHYREDWYRTLALHGKLEAALENYLNRYFPLVTYASAGTPE